MTTYTFRYRFEVAPRCTLSADDVVLLLGSTPEGHALELTSPSQQKISGSSRLVLRASGWKSAEEAEAAGKEYSDKLAVVLAKHRVGVELWKRRGGGFFTSTGLQTIGGGERVLNDEQGLMVFEAEPAPRFASMNAAATRGASREFFLQSFESLIPEHVELQTKERIALDLFNASFFEPGPDTRFITLIMAIEALLDLQLQSESAVALVESFIKEVSRSSLLKSEKESIAGRLRWLRRESIRGAGRRFVTERLAERAYGGESAGKFFVRCYDIRSELVHGSDVRETIEKVRKTVAELELFVSDLLTEPYLPTGA